MPGNKYIKVSTTGSLEEVLSSNSSTGAPDANKIVSLDSQGKLDETMFPTGIGADVTLIIASEALSAGDFVNIFEDTGTTKVRKADATTSGKEADGFVLSSASSGANASVYFEGTNNQVTGQTIGSVVFLHTTAGGSSNTSPSTAGNIVQKIGKAINATSITFEPSLPITLA